MKKIFALAISCLLVNISFGGTNNKDEMTNNGETKTAISSSNIVVYPNSATNGGKLNLDFSDDDYSEVIIVVQDILGNEYYSKLLMVYQQNLKIGIDMENRIPSGVYRIIACSDNDMYNKSIVVE